MIIRSAGRREAMVWMLRNSSQMGRTRSAGGGTEGLAAAELGESSGGKTPGHWLESHNLSLSIPSSAALESDSSSSSSSSSPSSSSSSSSPPLMPKTFSPSLSAFLELDFLVPSFLDFLPSLAASLPGDVAPSAPSSAPASSSPPFSPFCFFCFFSFFFSAFLSPFVASLAFLCCAKIKAVNLWFISTTSLEPHAKHFCEIRPSLIL
mmetsp:Transcript_33414/g.56092  ORF Transcript_33414/g.56092 Transcript_33414/m.56092 type:complete len:207 (-) Transcript_33414:732-1352(-)